MGYSSQILFFIGVIGAFNALILSLFILLNFKKKNISLKLLGAFLFFLSLRIIKSVFYYFAPDEPISFLQTGPITFIFIGPFLYFYFSSVIERHVKFIRNWKLHLIIWIIIAILSLVLLPFKNNVELWKNYLIYVINIQWLFYLVLSSRLYRSFFFREVYENKEILFYRRWLLVLLLSIWVIWITYFSISYDYFITGPIIFSVIFYGMVIYYMANKKEFNTIFRDKERYAKSNMKSEVALALIDRLDTIMTEKKLYKNPELKSSIVAKELNISTHQFSQLLNFNLGKNFSSYINELRINEAKKILLLENSKYTFEAIGYECGFNSKSTFFTTFKRVVGTTPSMYVKKN